MPKLPDPSLISRGAPTPAGPAGALSTGLVRAPGADTSIGDALTGIGDEAFKFAQREKKRMDDVVVDDAKNRYLQKALELEGEYGQIKGKNAVDQDIVADYTGKLDAVAQEIAPSFKNDSQRRAWDTYYGKSKVQFGAGIMKHKLNESDTYATETYKATNATRIQNAHSNWANGGVVNNSAADIVKNIAKEKMRAGWDDERTEAEMMATLGPLWSGVAAQYINAKQYDMAKKVLDQNKEVIGVEKYTSYHKSIEASQVIDLSQEKAADILGTVKGDEAQRKAAREIKGALGDATLQRVKIFQNEQRIEREETKRVQSENDIKWVSDFGAEALGKDTLTVEQVKKAGLGPETEALWITKVFAQGEKKDKQVLADFSNDVYAGWLADIAADPHKYTPEMIAKDIDPNNGGLTGDMFRVLVSDLTSQQINKPKTSASAAATATKTMLKSMYDRGDFGAVKQGEKGKKTNSWKTYSNILIDLQRKTIEEPTVDHTEWFNKRIEKEATEALYEKLDADWTLMGMGDESDQIISDWLKQRGKAVSRKNIEAVRRKWKK